LTIQEVIGAFRAVSYGEIYMGAAVYIDLCKLNFRLCPELEDALIFSGITIIDRTSTINSEEEIISKIMRQENLKLNDRTFYDLQTYKGYKNVNSGKFVLNKLIAKKTEQENILVTGWGEISIPSPIFRFIFQCIIGISQEHPFIKTFNELKN